MSDTATTDTTDGTVSAAVEVEPQLVEEALLLEDVLVEDVSIDGMCGVY